MHRVSGRVRKICCEHGGLRVGGVLTKQRLRGAREKWEARLYKMTVDGRNPCAPLSSHGKLVLTLIAVAPCEVQSSPANPQRRLCVSNRSRCGAVRISKLADEPSAEICACRIALAVVFAKFKYKSSMRSTLPQLRPESRKF